MTAVVVCWMSLDPTEIKECTICAVEFEEADTVMRGFIGILPVSFCCTCSTGILDFADQREVIFQQEDEN